MTGDNVFPSQIESLLVGVPECEPHYVLVVRREGALDELEVVVEAKAEVAARGAAALAAAAQKVRQKIHGVVGITVGVKVVPPKTVERSIGRAKRVIDERPKTLARTAARLSATAAAGGPRRMSGRCAYGPTGCLDRGVRRPVGARGRLD